MKIFKGIIVSKEEEEIAKILENINIFRTLTPNERVKIVRYFEQKTYKPGELIVKEGEEGDRMFIIKEGAVKVTKKLADGGEEVLANLVDGDFFGEMALLDGSPRSASVYAVSPVQMLELYRSSLEEFIQKNPGAGVKILYNIAVILAKRIRSTGDRIRDLIVWQSLLQK